MQQDGKVSRSVVILSTSAATFSACLMSMALAITLPAIGAEFRMEAHLLGWVATSFVLVTAAFMIPIGRLSDIHGRKKIFSYGLIVFFLSCILCAVAQSPALLIAMRVVQGLGAAMIWGPSVSILSSAFPPNERGKVIGINTFAVYCGLALGPFWGGILTQSLGWRSVFYFTSIFVVIAAVLTFWKLKAEWAESRGEKLDVVGASTITLSLMLILYGFSTLPSLTSIAVIVFGIIGLVVFYRIALNKNNPVLNVNLFRGNRVFNFTLGGMLLGYCANYAPIFLISLYLQYNKGLSPQTAGAMLVIQPVFMALVALFAGRSADKMDPLKVSSVGLVLQCMGLGLFSFISEATSLWLVALGLAFVGAGTGTFASPIISAVMGSVDRKFFGVASGTSSTMRHTGQALSMAIIMLMFAIFIGDAEITPQYYGAYLMSARMGFLISTAIALIALVLVIAAEKLKGKTSDRIESPIH